MSSWRAHPRMMGVVYGLVAAAIWGAFYTVSRHAVGVGMAPEDIAFVRYATTGLILAPMIARLGKHIRAAGWWRGLALALLGGPPFVIVSASGYHFAPLSHAAVVQLGTATLICAVAGAWLLHERFGGKGIFGLAVLLGGLATVAGPGLFTGASQAWIGDALFVLAGIMWAVFTLLLRHWKIDALAATIAVSVLSVGLYCPLYLVTADLSRLAAAPLGVVIEQAVVQGVLASLVALFAYSRAVQLLGASRAAVFSAFAPIASILIGVVLVGEIPTALQWLGLVIASAGMIAILQPDPRPA
jgi:drug/metabolite transporter (DMT)-like permease